ncbi:hypothetical protein CWB77_13205 [Pseudoalteromonas sp. S1610]|uniref:phosphoribosyltransferase-like protein n=1 Tax=Pseudoalteromonas sp. S1610 TaxID=579506 RepID=UPI00110BF3AC|nr:hypothetical protein [Pseudoalteromonas sp. S1610]TMP59768.1 hypothetical protein CWB77_13205 [Pseudoalteromonas sp. S1610]
MTTNESLCLSISKIIKDYRNNEFGNYDQEHVQRWINQFEDHEQEIVLLETNRILRKNFITIEKFHEFADTVISYDGVYGKDQKDFWDHVSILQIQKQGNSQSELNKIFIDKLSKSFNVEGIINARANNYLYIDDFIFTGNRVFTDIRNWLQSMRPNNCVVHIATIGWYVYGQHNLKTRLDKLVQDASLNIKFVFSTYDNNIFENRLVRKDYSEIFWPTSEVESDSKIKGYVQENNASPKYRVENGIKNRVFSRPRREEYEKILLKYGLKIMSFPKNNNSLIKPLGYHRFDLFGFGSTIFNFRNCPNNNPLVFWWGDPKAPAYHPFSKWYPLLQRDTYKS